MRSGEQVVDLGARVEGHERDPAPCGPSRLGSFRRLARSEAAAALRRCHLSRTSPPRPSDRLQHLEPVAAELCELDEVSVRVEKSGADEESLVPGRVEETDASFLKPRRERAYVEDRESELHRADAGRAVGEVLDGMDREVRPLPECSPSEGAFLRDARPREESRGRPGRNSARRSGFSETRRIPENPSMPARTCFHRYWFVTSWWNCTSAALITLPSALGQRSADACLASANFRWTSSPRQPARN